MAWNLAVVHFDIIGMGAAVGSAIGNQDTVVRGFYGGTPCIDTGLGCQAGNLNGLRHTSRILVIYDIQRYCAIAVNGIRLVMSRSCTNKMIVAETVLLQNRVQVQIYRVAAQSGHGHMVIFRANGSTGNVVILQAGVALVPSFMVSVALPEAFPCVPT